jgi:hypothetical protein
MWCWHRIRESESGLCPACRTPYGNDPHEFSAVDMQEVLKANKEKAAAERREKERLRHIVPPPVNMQHRHLSVGSGHHISCAGGIHSFSQAAGGGGGVDAIGGIGTGGLPGGVGTVGPGGHFLSAAAVAAAENSMATPLDNSSAVIHFGDKATTVIDRSRSLEAPKDRSSLANMRVIRRTLVYAVGLPQDIATEPLLNKPEYFCQYGKISKIVINRNYNGNGDPRRASASAYVTFVHKVSQAQAFACNSRSCIESFLSLLHSLSETTQPQEDTLACILALDGFVLDGRHIRASYGTSKYCSAFIKNVRCNNPECTYLHHLGLPEDSFTKQEIQAGYVTSGRDVLAKQQAAMAAAASVNGQTRKRVGGGGPTGTGAAAANPVLPAPEFDEPVRSIKSVSGFLAPPVGVKQRSISVGSTVHTSAPNSGNGPSGFAAAAAGAVSSGNVAPAPIHITKIRPPPVVTSLSSKPTPAPAPAPMPAPAPVPAPTAASVVASAKSTSPTSIPPPHTTLTSLTPLKRSTSLPAKGPPVKSSGAHAVASSKASTTTAAASAASAKPLGTIGSARKLSSITSTQSSRSGEDVSLESTKSSLDGDAIGGANIFGSGILCEGSSALASTNSHLNDYSQAQGLALSPPSNSFGAIGSSSHPLPPQPHEIGVGAIGSSHYMNGVIGGRAPGSHLGGGSDWKSGDTLFGRAGGQNGGLWSGAGSGHVNGGLQSGLHSNGAGGFGVIGGTKSQSSRAPGGDILVGGPTSNANAGGGVFGRDSGTSALASILGISLPNEGSGSLRETLPGHPAAPSAAAPFAFSSVPIGGLGDTRNRNTNHQDSLWLNTGGGGAGVVGGLNNPSYQPAPIGSRAPVGRQPQQPMQRNDNSGGGIPIGGSSNNNRAPGAGRPSANNDIALLQSLLPGVHVTTSSGGNPSPFLGMNQNQQHLNQVGWGTAPGPSLGGPSVIGSGRQSAFGGGVNVPPGHGPIGDLNSAWGAQPGGAFYGQQQADQQQQQQQQRQGSNIW